jgi:membrane protease YdiL (CAAX protease family)
MDNTLTEGLVPVPSNRLVQTMRRHSLLCYFLIAFALTWACELLMFGILHIPFSSSVLWPLILTLVGPTAGAFLMTGITQGAAGIRQLLRRYVLWHVSVSWYLVALLAVPTLFLLPYLFQPGALSAFRLPGLSFWVDYLIVFLLTLVFGGPLGEEPGWRGFALPRHEQYSGPLVGTLLLGVLWALWHVPLFLLVPGYNGAGTGFLGILIPFVAFTVMVTAYSVMFTWVFNNTRGSILLAIVLHASINTAPAMLPSLFPSLKVNSLFGVSTLLVWIVVALVIIAATRRRLSYQRYQKEGDSRRLREGSLSTRILAPAADQEKEDGKVRISA